MVTRCAVSDVRCAAVVPSVLRRSGESHCEYPRRLADSIRLV